MNCRSILLLLSLALGAALPGHSQSAFGAAANEAVINSQQHQWSVGEMCAVGTATSPSLLLTQGFLQPAGGLVPTQEADLIFTDLRVSPNPTAAIATLWGYLPAGLTGPLTIQLWNAEGRVIQSGIAESQSDGFIRHTLDLTSYPAGTYFLCLQHSTSTKTISIVKL